MQSELVNIAVELSAGNTGCANAIVQHHKYNTEQTIEVINKLRELGIKGTDVYVLYNDIAEYDFNCLHSIVKYTEPSKLITACSKQDRTGKYILRDELQAYYTRDEDDVNAQPRDDVY